jgi:hypothetical protein
MIGNELHQQDFVESLFWQDLEVSQELDAYVRSLRMDQIDHVTTSFYQSEMDVRLAELTMRCVEDFFIAVGKRLSKTGLHVLKMWVQKYDKFNYHPIHVHAPDAFNYSFVFYLDCTDNSAPTMFYNLGYPYVDHTNFKIQPKKGRCVLFPGAMPHEALPNQDDKRLIVSGNIFYFDRDKMQSPGGYR